MPRRWTLLRALFAVMLFTGAACRATSPLPLPDAARETGVRLRSTPPWLVIRPGNSGRLRFEVRDDSDQPIPDYPLTFSIVPTPEGADTAGATLSARQGLSASDGTAVVEVIVGALASNDRPVSFTVRATCPGAPAKDVTVLVTTNAYSVEILPLPEDDLLASPSLVSTRLYFYDNAACADLDVYNIGASVGQARAPNLVPAGGTLVYPGVSGTGIHAVLGLGLDSSQNVLVGGCVDVPGAALLESEVMRVVLFMDHPFPTIAGTYQVLSDFRLDQPPAALAGIRGAWQQWTRCPLDPARLWIDCTLAALDPNAKPCGAVASNVGGVAQSMLQSRGAVVPALTGTLATPSDLPCRSAIDGTGKASLEAVVDGLFADARVSLANHSLATFPAELARLLDDVRLDSRLTLALADTNDTYLVDHQLLTVTFPDAMAPASFSVATLALPATRATGIPGIYKSGQLGVPPHSFTLRLGTTARMAFEATSLKARNVQDSAALVERIFGLAQMNDARGRLTGCSALDAAACDLIKQPRGCLGDACRNGLAALTQNLAGAFTALDGPDLDFQLYGSAPVIDIQPDGRADAFGTPTLPGLWTAILESAPEAYMTVGVWTATRTTPGP